MPKFVKSKVKKLLISFLASLIVLLSFAPYFPARAQSTWYNQNPFEWYIKVYDENTSPSNEIFGERYTAAQVQWVIWSLFATGINLPFTMLGMPPTPSVCVSKLALGLAEPIDCSKAIQEFISAVTDKISPLIPVIPLTDNGVDKNLAGSSTQNSIWKKIFLEDRPISGIAYVRNIGRKLTLVPEAKAADSFGFSRLFVIQDLWKFSRNFAYFFFVLAIIVTAFMIMFKVKISPQAVISIQSALPKIIITLILVTFSYAIAGFLIDLMYVIMGIFSLILSASGLLGTTIGPNFYFNFISGFNTSGLAILLYWVIFLVLYIVATMAAYISALLSLGATGVIWSLLLGVFTIILFFILIFDFFRITFALFKALAGFYIAVIVGPFQLAVGALPQSKNPLGSWIKSLISKLAVFPATGILFFFSIFFVFKSILISLGGMIEGNIIVELLRKIPNMGPFLSSIGISPTNPFWGPPMLNNGASATSIAFILMGISCILLIPKMNKMIESALKGREFDMETAIGQPVKMTTSAAGTGLEAWGKAQKKGSAGPVAATIGGVIQSLSR